MAYEGLSNPATFYFLQCRARGSGCQDDGDHCSDGKPITFRRSSERRSASSESFYQTVFMKRAGQASGRLVSTERWRNQVATRKVARGMCAPRYVAGSRIPGVSWRRHRRCGHITLSNSRDDLLRLALRKEIVLLKRYFIRPTTVDRIRASWLGEAIYSFWAS
jgi:hypothetical protein